MTEEFKASMIEVCNTKIEAKGSDVGLSFYAFFKNKNDKPELLMSIAKWWIEENQFDHFEKAIKIKNILEAK